MTSPLKRLFDLFASLSGLLLLAPVFLLVSLAIRVDSPGPIFFRQERVGRYGKIFRIHKFRTMIQDAEQQGLQITAGIDPRMTRTGRFLRKYKLDELPQLFDVVIGKMSLVGPRPEVPQYVDYYPVETRTLIQTIRPGVTDNASIEFRFENAILGQSSNPHQTYIDEILPIKLHYYEDYVRNRSFWGDIWIILKTLRAIVR